MRVGGRCLQVAKERAVLFDQWLDVGIEVGRRNSELVWPADARGQCVGEVLVRAHHLDAGEVDGLSWPARQLFLGGDLRAPLCEDGLEVAEGLVVRMKRLRLHFGEGGRLSLCTRDEAERADVGREEPRRRDGEPESNSCCAHRTHLHTPQKLPVPHRFSGLGQRWRCARVSPLLQCASWRSPLCAAWLGFSCGANPSSWAWTFLRWVPVKPIA